MLQRDACPCVLLFLKTTGNLLYYLPVWQGAQHQGQVEVGLDYRDYLKRQFPDLTVFTGS